MNRQNAWKIDTISPLGKITLAAKEERLVGAWLPEQKYHPKGEDFQEDIDGKSQLLKQAKRELEEYFSLQRKTFDVPMDFSAGTFFQQKIWLAL